MSGEGTPLPLPDQPRRISQDPQIRQGLRRCGQHRWKNTDSRQGQAQQVIHPGEDQVPAHHAHRAAGDLQGLRHQAPIGACMSLVRALARSETVKPAVTFGI